MAMSLLAVVVVVVALLASPSLSMLCTQQCSPVWQCTCEAGWDKYESSCYKAFGHRTDWDDAQSRCINKGAHLATTLSQGEENFVRGLLDQDSWIGLQKPHRGNVFFWVTDEYDTYSKHPQRLCVYFCRYNDGYYDTGCNDQLGYVCEKCAS